MLIDERERKLQERREKVVKESKNKTLNAYCKNLWLPAIGIAQDANHTEFDFFFICLNQIEFDFGGDFLSCLNHTEFELYFLSCLNHTEFEFFLIV